MLLKPTLAFILSNILIFLDNISELDIFFKLTTFIVYLIFMYVSIIEKISAVKKAGYLNEHKGSWVEYLVKTGKEFVKNLTNGRK